MAEWLAFVASRDAAAGALWLLSIALGVIVWKTPGRLRWLTLLLVIVYTLVALS